MDKPIKNNKVSVKILAIGFASAFAFMQTSLAVKTFNTVWYNEKIELYVPLNILIAGCMLFFGIWAGGSMLTNIKGIGR